MHRTPLHPSGNEAAATVVIPPFRAAAGTGIAVKCTAPGQHGIRCALRVSDLGSAPPSDVGCTDWGTASRCEGRSHTGLHVQVIGLSDVTRELPASSYDNHAPLWHAELTAAPVSWNSDVAATALFLLPEPSGDGVFAANDGTAAIIPAALVTNDGLSQNLMDQAAELDAKVVWLGLGVVARHVFLLPLLRRTFRPCHPQPLPPNPASCRVGSCSRNATTI